MATGRQGRPAPGADSRTFQDRSELTTKRPHKPLTDGKSSSGGSQLGRADHQPAPRRRRQAPLPANRLQASQGRIPATVATIEYDPNRTCFIALLHYADGDKRYILAPAGARPRGQRAVGRAGGHPRRATRFRSRRFQPGPWSTTWSWCPGRAPGSVRAAGGAIQVVAKEGAMVTLRLPSSEVRMVRAECRATVGALSNAEHQNVKLGKAGRKRHMGQRPQTRGVAMNPVDHPHGGGEAHHTPGGHPVTPWGKPTLGYRTRKKRKRSDARDRPRTPPRPQEEEAAAMGRSTKKGPLAEERLMQRIERMNESGREGDDQDLVADRRSFPGDGRAHDRRPRRSQARARVRLRVDGRPQARRVRADANVPRPLGRGQPAGGAQVADGPGRGQPMVRAKARYLRTSPRKVRPRRRPGAGPADRGRTRPAALLAEGRARATSGSCSTRPPRTPRTTTTWSPRTCG